MNTTTTLSSVPKADQTEASQLAPRPGIMAGTVLRAARLSAHLTQAELGVAIGVDEATIAEWEDGADPLTAVAYPVLERLETALADARGEPALIRDLTFAIWCDLVIAAIADSQDISCLLADPAAADGAFCELLAWSAGGQRPHRYRPYVGPDPLFSPGDLDSIARAIRKLSQAGQSLGQCAA